MSDQQPGRLAILISGRGSNMQAFVDACRTGALNADIVLVASNNPEAAGLAQAASQGINTVCIDHRDYSTREAFDTAMATEVARHSPDAVILAGFMRILTPAFIEPFSGKLLNVHPSLLPKYPGLHTHQRALDAGDKEAGTTVHFVTLELDGGPPIIRCAVPIKAGDTADTLASRVVGQEHIVYPIAASWLLQGRLKLGENGATLDGKPIPETGIDYVPENI